MRWNRQTFSRLAAVAALALAVQALPGCGRQAGSVSGKVTLKGQPVPGGTVTFLGADDRAASCPIEADGTYTIDRVAVGVAKVAVAPPVSAAPKGVKMDPGKMGAPADPGAAAAAPAKRVAIPEQYQDPTQSGLTCDVKAGHQDYNIDLK